MIVIRTEQMNVFKKTALLSFEDEMVEHLAKFSPPLYKVVGEEQMRKVIQLGMSQVAKYGFTYRGPIRLYLELMLLFGSYFDTDPQYPWAAEIFINQESGAQMQRAKFLYEKALDYQEKVVGPDDGYLLEALKKNILFLRHPLSVTPENYLQDILKEIAQIYPQKTSYVGIKGLEAIIRKGIEGAQRQRLGSMRGMTVVIILMFVLGHGCGGDPIYSWIIKILNDKDITEREGKIQDLEKHLLSWLEYRLSVH